MDRTTRISFLALGLALAACGDDTGSKGFEDAAQCENVLECDDLDPCTDDVCEGTNFRSCMHTPIVPCSGDGLLSGDFRATALDNGNLSFFGLYSTETSWTDYLASEEAKLTAPVVGACADLPFVNSNSTHVSLGDVLVKEGATTWLTMTPTANGRYEGFFAAAAKIFDLGFNGIAIARVDPSTAAGVVVIPDKPVFSDTTFMGDTIDATFTYTPIVVDNLFLRFDYFDGQPHQLTCRLDPAGTTFTMDATAFASLPASGNIRAYATNVRRAAVRSSDMPRSIAVTTSVSTANGTFTK